MSRDDALVLDIVLAAKDVQDFVQASTGLPSRRAACIRTPWSGAWKSSGGRGKLSAEFLAAHPAIPWRDIVNMRHRLIHAYSEVRLDIVWNVVVEHVPLLLGQLAPLVLPDRR